MRSREKNEHNANERKRCPIEALLKTSFPFAGCGWTRLLFLLQWVGAAASDSRSVRSSATEEEKKLVPVLFLRLTPCQKISVVIPRNPTKKLIHRTSA